MTRYCLGKYFANLGFKWKDHFLRQEIICTSETCLLLPGQMSDSRGKMLPYLTPPENDVFFAGTVEPKQSVFLQRNCSPTSYLQTRNY